MKQFFRSLITAALVAILGFSLAACGATTQQPAPAPPQPGPVYDEAAYQSAVDAVLAEYSALTVDALADFDEAVHPELPWYTAAIANTDRNSLYYAFRDFDGNDIPELVISAGDDSYQQPMGLYAFDGEKMVYLCKEQALGERAFVSYFHDGLFAIHASGGAAVGSVTLWRIASDGYSTEVVEIMDYEYQDADTVVYTPQLGNMTVEEFKKTDYLQGFNPLLDYTKFASQTDVQADVEPIETANPWQGAASADEAAQGAGLNSFVLPQALSCFPGGYETAFLYMESLAEVVYSDETCRLVLRKGLGEDDISGDYNEYPDSWELEHEGLTIHCAGSGNTVSLARWVSDGNAYSLGFYPDNAAAPGLSQDEIISLVSQIR